MGNRVQLVSPEEVVGMITEIVLGSFVFGYGVLAVSLFISAGRQLISLKARKSR
jgi:hypothetical protein